MAPALSAMPLHRHRLARMALIPAAFGCLWISRTGGSPAPVDWGFLAVGVRMCLFPATSPFMVIGQCLLLLAAEHFGDAAPVALKVLVALNLLELTVRRTRSRDVVLGASAVLLAYLSIGVDRPDSDPAEVLYKTTLAVGTPLLAGGYLHSTRRLLLESRERAAEAERGRVLAAQMVRTAERTARGIQRISAPVRAARGLGRDHGGHLRRRRRYAGSATREAARWEGRSEFRRTKRNRTVGTGHGIIGLRERAALLGGALHAGPDAAGKGRRMIATLPPPYADGEPSIRFPSVDQGRVVDIAEAARSDGLDVELGGPGIKTQQAPSAHMSELVGIVAAAVILFLAFGSVLAMAVPIITAVVGLGTAVFAMGLPAHAFPIADLAPTLGALVGLGVGIDYALFIVTRHRSGLKAGLTNGDSVIRA